MGAWMDGWMDRGMDGGMDGWMDGWMDEWMNGSIDGRRADGWMKEAGPCGRLTQQQLERRSLL